MFGGSSGGSSSPPLPDAPPPPPNPPMFGADASKAPKRANPNSGFGGTILAGTGGAATTSNKTLLGS